MLALSSGKPWGWMSIRLDTAFLDGAFTDTSNQLEVEEGKRKSLPNYFGGAGRGNKDEETHFVLESPVLMVEPPGSRERESGPEGAVTLPLLGKLTFSNFRRHAAGSLVGVVLQPARPAQCLQKEEELDRRISPFFS